MSLTNYIPDEEFTIPTRKVLIEEVRQGYDLTRWVIHNRDLPTPHELALAYLSMRFHNYNIQINSIDPQNEFVFRLPNVKNIFLITLHDDVDYKPCSIDGYHILYFTDEMKRKYFEQVKEREEYVARQSMLFNHNENCNRNKTMIERFTQERITITHKNIEAVKTLLGK